MTQVGTPFYIAPEICGNRVYTNKVDMWSLGCSAGQCIPFPLVLFELIAKHPPFHGSSIGGLFHSIIYTPVRLVSCCSIDAASSLLLPFTLCPHRSEFAPCTPELGS